VTDDELKAMFAALHRMCTLEEMQSKLEDAISNLQTRVERLEGSTH
jgi:predicted RecB family endonuclease